MKQFYDRVYKEEPASVSRKPHEAVRFASTLITPGTVLDLGAGNGRNALFLAKEGFAVTAVDVSTVGLASISETAAEIGVSLKAVEADISSYNVTEVYDCIISTFTLHFLPRESARALIDQMKEHTAPGGLNVLGAFLDIGEIYTASSRDRCFFKNGELRNIYESSGWNIEAYEEKEGIARQKNAEGNNMKNHVVYLVARKPLQ